MFRRTVTRMGLLALSGLGLLLVAGPAKADPQGWPVAGNWDSYGGSSPSSFGSYSPYYYSTFENSMPPNAGYYSPANSGYYYSPPATGGYSYGSLSSDDYYGTPTNATSTKRPVRINLRVPVDAKIWFDGNQTNQTGTARSFESPPLAGGGESTYQIRIQWKQDGKDITQTRQIIVHAGDVVNLALYSSPGSSQARVSR
jgi:uncharacterized protein (TIGR03000 family)